MYEVYCTSANLEKACDEENKIALRISLDGSRFEDRQLNIIGKLYDRNKNMGE